MPEDARHSDQKRNLLEKYLRGELGQTPAKESGIPRRPPGEVAPLSLTQQELWFRELRVPDIPPLYNECITLHMKGPLDVAVLEQSFTEIVRRHEAWRTTFETVDGQPVQVVQQPAKIKLPIIDLCKLDKAEREAEAVRGVAEDAKRPFDLRGSLTEALRSLSRRAG